MSLLLFEGAAGTGKTTSLIAAVRDHLNTDPLGAEQRILALTKYHGSRRRMDSKLRDPKTGAGKALDCVTIDSFAWGLVERWKALSNCLGLNPVRGDFGSITSTAGALLQRVEVARWVARRYPVVVVDEMQDCKAGEVSMLRGLEPHVRLFCGADAYQDLSGDSNNEAIDWATSTGDVTPLDKNHRARTAGLHSAAYALRAGLPLISDRNEGFEIVTCQSAGQAGALMCWRIRSWKTHGQIAVISATAKGTSPFCDSAIDWTSTKSSTAKSGSTAGPYPTPWESSDEDLKHDILTRLGIPKQPIAAFACAELASRAEQVGLQEVNDWLRRQMFVHGRTEVNAQDVINAVAESVRRRRAFGNEGTRDRLALTIHQAKNREFESVVVLWPLKLKGSLESKRRLLYNAVTRAQGRAIVIVQDPKKDQLSGPLFIGSLKAI